MDDSLLEFEMAETATGIVRDCLEVRPDEEVFVIADPRTFGVARSITTAARSVGADVVTAVMPLLESHGNEPLDTIAEGMATADVAFTCTTHAITHTHARLRAAEAGTRIGILRSVTEEMMVDGAMAVDFVELRRRTEAVRDVLDAGSEVRVTCPNGTDVSFSIEGCDAFSLDGYFHEEYGFATLPPGESPTHPKEGTANGRIVIDVSMDDIGRLAEPITLDVVDGFVDRVSGGEEAAQLRAIFDGADGNARNLAEFAVGTNPKAKLMGNLAEDKKREGTVHFAVGDNESLGGTTPSRIHLDGVIRTPTVVVDGTTLVDDGRLVREAL